MKQKELPVVEIEATAGTQVRRFLDPHVIEAYAEALQAGAIFPPVVVFAEKGSERYVLADGFHRLAAAKLAERGNILCEVHTGRVHDALAYALGANDEHGLRRTNKDKRNAIEIALKDPEWSTWSAVDISRLCRVDQKTVTKVREDMVLSGAIDEPETVKTIRKGKVVERKAGRASYGNPDERDSKGKTSTSSFRSGPKTQEQIDHDDFFALAERANGLSYDGGWAADSWQAWHRAREVELLRDWCNEFLGACKAHEEEQAA